MASSPKMMQTNPRPQLDGAVDEIERICGRRLAVLHRERKCGSGRRSSTVGGPECRATMTDSKTLRNQQTWSTAPGVANSLAMPSRPALA